MTAIHPTSPPMRRCYADWEHGQIHYYDSAPFGEEPVGIPIVLMHQSPASSSDWFHVLPHLSSAGLRVIAMDFPGMGMSDGFGFTPHLADYTRALIAVLDGAQVQRADLAGYHTGVHVALEAAMAVPARVRSLALYGVAVLDDEERQALWEQIVPNEKEGALHRPLPGGTNLSDHFRRLEGYFGPVVAQRMLIGALMAGPNWWHGHNAALRHDLLPALMAVSQPMLLMTNAREMLDAGTRKAARLRPDARLVDLGVESSVALEDAPEALASAVLAFLAELSD